MYTRPQINPASGSSRVPLVPKNNYRVAVLGIDRSPSKSSGARMVTATVQILSPESVQLPDGRTAKTAGVEGRLRFVLSEKNLSNIIDAITKLQIKVPPAAESFEEDMLLLEEALATGLTQLTFEMVIASKQEPQLGPAGEILTDSLNNPITRETVDFALFGIVGVPKTFAELGLTATQAPY